MGNFIPIIIIAIVVLVALFIIGLVMARMYVRATQEMAFVRTGFGKRKVIKEGGAMVLPVLHKIIWVKLSTLKLVVAKRNEDALITKDRMRVDVMAEFYMRVKPDDDGIANAAQTLGDKTLKIESLKELIEGKFVDGLRAVAAEMAMEELHEQRSEFVQKVQNNVSGDLSKNGLELETVSLTGLDQTDIKYFNENNAFDAEGKTKLTKIIEEKKKIRNDIEKTNEVEIEQRNLEAEKKKLEINKENEYASLKQQREISNKKAEEDSSMAKIKAEQEKDAKEAEITAEKEVGLAKVEADKLLEEKGIEKDQAIQEATIAKEKTIELANQDRDIKIAKKSEEKSQADKDANKALAEAVSAEEKVTTARETEVAERNKSVAVIQAKQTEESAAQQILVKAQAEKDAAENKAEAIKVEATANAEAVIISADAKEKDYTVDAEGKEKLNEAENKLSEPIISMRIKLETISQMSSIIEASVKPIEKIDAFKVINVSGLTGGGYANGNGNGHGAPIPQNLVNQLLQYRASAPMIDDLIKSLNLGDNLADVVNKSTESLTQFAPSPPVGKTETPAKVSEDAKSSEKVPSTVKID
jgi:uncharacterized membrane protein YqiK